MDINIAEMMRIRGRLKDIDSELKTILENVNGELDSVSSNLRSDGLHDAIVALQEKIRFLSDSFSSDSVKLEDFMEQQLKTYTVTNEEASSSLKSLVDKLQSTFNENGEIISHVAVSSTFNSMESAIDTSVYRSVPEKGFNVSTGNTVYEVTDDDRKFIYSVVAAEAINDYDDALAVISVVLNRCESDKWAMASNNTPVGQLKRKGQFSAYLAGNYKKYYNGSVAIPETIQRAVDDALNGVRNCSYLGFNAGYVKNYHGVQISKGGNQYK